MPPWRPTSTVTSHHLVDARTSDNPKLWTKKAAALPSLKRWGSRLSFACCRGGTILCNRLSLPQNPPPLSRPVPAKASPRLEVAQWQWAG
jgi:hypothetical protein